MRSRVVLALLLACSTAEPETLKLARESVPDASVQPVDVRWAGHTFYVAATGTARVGLAVGDAGEVLGGRAAAERIAPQPSDDPAQVAALVHLLIDPDPAARGVGLHLAGEGPDPRVRPPGIEEGVLTYWRRDPGEDRWVQCRLRLSPLGQVQCRPASVVKPGDPPPLEPVDQARAKLASEVERDRARGYELLATLRTAPDERTRPTEASELLLTGAQTDPAPVNRVKAIRLLGAQRFPSAIDPLRAVLRDDEHRDVRLEALRVLGRWKATEALPEIRAAAAQDSSEEIRNTARQVLIGLGAG